MGMRRSGFGGILMFLVVGLGAAVSGCGGPESATEATMFAWAQACNGHLATSDEHEFPRKSLDEIDPALTAGLSDTDGWDQPLRYRRLRDDRYQIISAGSDGEYGNDDDLIVENGTLMVASEAYAKKPLK